MREHKKKPLRAGRAAAGRPREFDDAQVLTALMRVFWAKGYEGTSLSDLTAATGLQKGSLYAAFGNKAAMYAQALSHYENEVVRAGCRMLRGDGSAIERLSAFMRAPLSAPVDKAMPRGCFLCVASSDHAGVCGETAQAVTRGFNLLQDALAEAIAEAQPDWPASVVQSRAAGLLVTYAGLRGMARSGGIHQIMERAAEQALDSVRPA